MKEKILIFSSALCLMLPQVLQAQGTIYLSNLGYASATNTIVASDSWRAAIFQTGTNSLGYTLNSILLLMEPASGNPTGFTVMLYSGGGVPGNYLGTLTGPDPAAGGVFTYAASSLTLSPVTFYYVVVTAATAVAVGNHNWSISGTGQFTANDGWRLGGAYYGSPNGANWIPYRPNPFQFAVEATAIPEPSIAAMMALGLAALGLLRCRK